jgi:ABC-2 type transport system permease protein
MTTATSPARHAASSSSEPTGALVGSGTLLRFYLRVSRLRVTLWIVGLVLLNVSTATAFPGLYVDAASRQERAVLMDSSPSSIAFSGPGFGLDDYTFGAMMTNEMLGFMAIIVAIMAVFLVVRHSRADEEAGRTELVRAAIVGRHAPLAAAFGVGALTSLAVGLLSAVGLGASGVESLTWTGSFVYGAALASVGLVFSAVGLLTAQVTEHARTASGLAGVAIGVAFVLRAVGDIGENALRWLSPIGWAQQTAAYVLDRWWPLLLALGLTVVLVALALVFNDRRDVGAGLVQSRPGKETASPRLGTPPGLAIRLQRGGVIGWGLAMIAFGGVYGTLMNEVESFASDNEAVQDILPDIDGAAMIDSFLSLIVSMMAMIIGVFVVQAVLRIRSEETSGRAEPVLATSVSRVTWAWPHVAIAVVGGVIITMLSVAMLGGSGAVVLGWSNAFTDSLAAGAATIPALLVVAGVATALVGWVPRFAPLAWLLVFWTVLVGMFGGLLQFPDWVMNISPFAHIPAIPAESVSWPPLIILTAIGLVLIVFGLLGLRRRDIYTT